MYWWNVHITSRYLYKLNSNTNEATHSQWPWPRSRGRYADDMHMPYVPCHIFIIRGHPHSETVVIISRWHGYILLQWVSETKWEEQELILKYFMNEYCNPQSIYIYDRIDKNEERGTDLETYFKSRVVPRPYQIR